MKRLFCVIVTFLMWVLMFWSLSLPVLVTGAVVSAVTMLLLSSLYPEGMEKVFNPARWFFFLVYLPFFLWECLKANLDVAMRVLHPDVPIHPGIVKVQTTLKSDMAKTFLANSITLTPGTLTIDIDGQDFYIHWINIDTDDPAKRTAEICGRFEPLLRRIFE